MSLPAPPYRVSLPPRPLRVSLPAPPSRVSPSAWPFSVSLPPRPEIRFTLPASPERELAASVPVITTGFALMSASAHTVPSANFMVPGL